MDISNVYQQFDGIICITLEHATERQIRFENDMKRLNVPFEFLKVPKSKYNGKYGCLHTHIIVANMALEHEWNNVLVFEDDAYPTSLYDDKIMWEVVRFMNEHKSWDRISLGYCPYAQIKSLYTNSVIEICSHFVGFVQYLLQPCVHGYPNLCKMPHLLTHAYVLSRSGMKKVIEDGEVQLSKKQDCPHLDKWMNYILPNTYITTKAIFDQHWSLPTYNVTNDTLFEGMWRKVQHWMEVYQLMVFMSQLRTYRIYWMLSIFIIIIAIIIYRSK